MLIKIFTATYCTLVKGNQLKIEYTVIILKHINKCLEICPENGIDFLISFTLTIYWIGLEDESLRKFVEHVITEEYKPEFITFEK